MQLYESVAIKDAWWNICCRGCWEPVADNPYREVRITWSEILEISLNLWGPPNGFFTRDFLISMEFRGGQIVVTFCSQGARRGEVEISIPHNDVNAHTELAAFLAEVRAIIEGERDDKFEEDGWKDESVFGRDEDDWEDYDG